jgi:threonine/homoserine/homoserine lactone efflux protein
VDSSVWAFLGISVLVIVTPGPDTALTIRNTVVGGRPGGIFTALGVSAGQLVWALATSAGVVALLLASEPVFHAVKLGGAAYLIYLGARSLLAAVRPPAQTAATTDGPPRRLGPRAAFRQGLVNNLGNPKMAVFFASVLPQFAREGEGMLSVLVLLGVVFSALTLAWLALYAAAIAAVGRALQRSGLRRAIEGLSGAVLMGLGARLAAESR